MQCFQCDIIVVKCGQQKLQKNLFSFKTYFVLHYDKGFLGFLFSVNITH